MGYSKSKFSEFSRIGTAEIYETPNYFYKNISSFWSGQKELRLSKTSGRITHTKVITNSGKLLK